MSQANIKFIIISSCNTEEIDCNFKTIDLLDHQDFLLRLQRDARSKAKALQVVFI